MSGAVSPVVILIERYFGGLHVARFSCSALASSLAPGSVAASPPQQQMPPATVGVIGDQGTAGDADHRTARPHQSLAVSEIRPQITGIVKARLFVEGSTVKAGQALYQIDPAPYQAAYDSAAATLASTKAKAERYAAPAEARTPSRRRTHDDAKAAYLQAKANADAARINLNYTRITAPITGRIGASTVTEGALVTAQQATALTTISTLDPIYVDVDQSSAELLALQARRAGRQRRIQTARSPPRSR